MATTKSTTIKKPVVKKAAAKKPVVKKAAAKKPAVKTKAILDLPAAKSCSDKCGKECRNVDSLVATPDGLKSLTPAFRTDAIFGKVEMTPNRAVLFDYLYKEAKASIVGISEPIQDLELEELLMALVIAGDKGAYIQTGIDSTLIMLRRFTVALTYSGGCLGTVILIPNKNEAYVAETCREEVGYTKVIVAAPVQAFEYGDGDSLIGSFRKAFENEAEDRKVLASMSFSL